MQIQVLCDLCGGKLVMQGAGNIVCEGCGMAYTMEYLKSKLSAAQSSAPAAAPTPAACAAPMQNYGAVIALAWQDIHSERYDAARTKADQVLSSVYDHAEAWSVRVSSTLRKDGLTAAAGELNAALKAVAPEKHRLVTEPIKEHMAAAKDISAKDVAAVASVCPELAQLAADQVAAAVKRLFAADFEFCRKNFAKEASNRPTGDSHFSSFYPTCYHYFLSSFNTIQYHIEPDLLPLARAITKYGLQIPKDLTAAADEVDRYLTDAMGFRIWAMEKNKKGDWVRALVSVVERKELQPNINKLRGYLKSLRHELENARLARVASYWHDHPEEKAALEKEAAELSAQLSAAKKELATNPSAMKLAEIDKTIEALNREKSSLGIFKSGRKKEIEAQLDGLYEQRHEIKKSSEAALRTLERKVAGLTEKLEAAEDKLDNP